MPARRGWFPDHWDPTVLREWDGERWTGRTLSTSDPDAAPPPLEALTTPGSTTDDDGFGRRSVASVLDRIAPRIRRSTASGTAMARR